MLRLGVLTDLHVSPAGTSPQRFNNVIELGHSRDLLRTALKWLRGRADALVVLGDLTDRADESSREFVADALTETGLATYVVAGNHDLAGNRIATGFTHTFTPPDRYPHVHIAGAELHADVAGYRTSIPRPPRPRSSDVLLWLSHFPALTLAGEIHEQGWRYAGDLTNRIAIESSLRSRAGPVVVLSGHLHVRAHAIKDNILQLSQAALAECPHDAAVVTIRPAVGNVLVERICHSVATSPAKPAVLDPAHTRFLWNGRQWRPLSTTPPTALSKTEGEP
jgi:calcineurin-like phosphoesterase family protein